MTNPYSNLEQRVEETVENPLAELIQKKIEGENNKAKEPTELERAFIRLCQTADGQLVLNWIMRECGYHLTGLETTTTGELSTKQMIKNEAQRHVWCIIRQFIPWQIRHVIEDPKPRDNEDGRTNDNGSAN